jgi:phytoene dehydrogenase-like protein
MPLQYVLDRLHIELEAEQLALPMVVHQNGQQIRRYESIENWISEAERVFGGSGQRAFWTYCYQIAQKVWQISLQQKNFPPKTMGDWLALARNFRWSQLAAIPPAFETMEALLKRYGLADNTAFRAFVDAQLLITAQNTANQVNVLFGATALCYTNFPNWYLKGGMRQLVDRLLAYITQQGGEIHFREKVTHIAKKNGLYQLTSNKGTYLCKKLVSSIPLNNLADVWENGHIQAQLTSKLLPAKQLNSAFQMGIGFVPHREYSSIHHQLLLPHPLPGIGSNSIFVSLHPVNDQSRAPAGEMVASVSTHWPLRDGKRQINSDLLVAACLDALEANDLLYRDSIRYLHHSGPHSWEKWTGRKYGFVGGYPQFAHIKPWEMAAAPIDGGHVMGCGDSFYPGQGIPATVLSGIIAAERLSF